MWPRVTTLYNAPQSGVRTVYKDSLKLELATIVTTDDHY